MTEYKFLMFYMSFLGFMLFMLGMGAPAFAVPGIAEPPTPPAHWWEWPGYLLGFVVYFFKLIVLPEVPTEIRILTFILFLPAIIVFVWIILKWIGPIIAQAIPF